MTKPVPHKHYPTPRIKQPYRKHIKLTRDDLNSVLVYELSGFDEWLKSTSV